MKVLDIIKYESDNNTFVWKHPAEDFNTLSQLIVHDSQEAVLFRDGQALDLFGPGRYTLHTQNIPLLRKLINLPTNGEAPFHCEVYFINKTMPLDMKWGTRSQVVVQDPKFNILLHSGANGGMCVQIDDTRSFLTKLVGTTPSFDKDVLIDYFREMIITHVKTYLTSVMSQVSFVTVNAKLDEMSEAMRAVLAEEVKKFGVKLVKFFISSIQLSKGDYDKIQNALANAGAMGITAAAEKNRMDTLGYNWADQEIAEIMKTYAANEGANANIGGMVAQMPMAMAFGQMIHDNAQSGFSGAAQMLSSNHAQNIRGKYCSNCGKQINTDAKFCSGCGKTLTDGQVCRSCGRILRDDENFCPNCGMKR